MKSKVTISCCLCREKHVEEIELPKGWQIRYDDIDEENGFCPEHSPVAEWAKAQCPGCAGGWGDCSLWRNFAYGNRLTLSHEDLDMIQKGICPRRTGGTFTIGASGMHNIDLSDKASTTSGEVLAQAILDYWKEYGIEGGGL